MAMTANRPAAHGKRAFVLLMGLLCFAARAEDAGWRLTVIPSFQAKPPIREEIPGSKTAVLTVARAAGYGEFEYATTRGALRCAKDIASAKGAQWIVESEVEIRRDKDGVVDRVLITGDNPLLPSLAVAPALYDRFEPVLGDGFHVIIPDRNTIALYPRIAGQIPANEAAALLEIKRTATYPVSSEVFRATRLGLVADGELRED